VYVLFIIIFDPFIVLYAGIFLGGAKGHFGPPENSFSPLDYASMIKLILIYKNHKIYRLAVI